MYADDNDASQRLSDEAVSKEEGVLVEPQGVRDVSREVERSVPDEYVEDPRTADDHPGTVDDVPYSMGTEVSEPADQHVVPEGATRQSGAPAPEEREQDLGRRDERELWARQKALIDEDEKSGVRLEGYSDEEARRVMDAMGDDSADPMQEYPGGTSATGSSTADEHGGFPKRK